MAGLSNLDGAIGGAAADPVLAVGTDVSSANTTLVTYQIRIRNHGTGTATGVVVRSVVPQNTTFETSTPAPSPTTSPGPGAPSCDNGEVREGPDTTCQWNLGKVAEDQTKTILATFNLSQSDVATFTVTTNVTVTEGEGGTHTDSDATLTRARLDINDDTWVNDNEPPNYNHGQCSYFRVHQDNSASTFLEADTLPPESAVERMWGAQLRATVLDTTYSVVNPGVLGSHLVTTGEWSEGVGTCAGTDTATAGVARTGAEPESFATATATAQVNEASQVSTWDVTADLDEADERVAAFNGWELRDATGAGDNATRFHSSEATAQELRPKLFVVYTTPEPPVVHKRSISLSLREHLKARGRLRVADSFPACVAFMQVKIQRRGPDGWVTVARRITSEVGKFRAPLEDRRGSYRARAAAESINAGHSCRGTISPVVKHTH